MKYLNILQQQVTFPCAPSYFYLAPVIWPIWPPPLYYTVLRETYDPNL